MSTATAEKQPSPLGSFLGKLTPPPAEKPAEVKAEVKEAPKVEEAIVKVKDEVKEPAKVEAKPVEKDEAITIANAEKRVKDTQKWGNEERQARLAAEQKANALQAQLARIEQKLDGTYEEPKAPSPAQIDADADTKGRIRASHHAAVRQYGKEFVMQTVWATDSPYQELQANSPAIRARVMEAEDPVLEAIAVVKEHQDGEKYGRTPEEIRKKIEAELTPKITQDILAGLKSKPGPVTRTLGNVRGDAERVSLKNEAPERLDFRAVFPWGAART